MKSVDPDRQFPNFSARCWRRLATAPSTTTLRRPGAPTSPKTSAKPSHFLNFSAIETTARTSEY